MNDRVLTHIDQDGNATVILNRPAVHNAFDAAMVDALDTALNDLGKNRGVRAIVLMGQGASFCAGADIAEMKKSASYTARQNFEVARKSARMLHTLHTLTKPTIACVRGAVRGGGCGLVAACDIAIASQDATFRLSEVKLGIIPAMISPYVIRAMGERMAYRYMLSGEEFDAAEAYRIGLVQDIVPPDALLAAVSRMLTHLYSSGPEAMAAVKQLIPFSARTPIDENIIRETSRRIADIRATAEAQEGLAAFLEKRKPAWVTPAAPKPAKRRRR